MGQTNNMGRGCSDQAIGMDLPPGHGRHEFHELARSNRAMGTLWNRAWVSGTVAACAHAPWGWHRGLLYCPRAGAALLLEIDHGVEGLVVTSEQVHAQAGLKRFEQAFAQADSAVAVGSRYSHALGILGTPIFSSTNSEGLIEAVFGYNPREMLLTRINWITNGFTLVVSNDVVIRKGYSYASNH